MRIYFSTGFDPMIVNSILGFNEIHERLREFLASESRSISLSANISGRAEPYEIFLGGLEIEKTQGPIHVSLSGTQTLKITGGIENLRIYTDFFRFREDEDGSHHHPEYVRRVGYIAPGTLSVIIEADDEIEPA